MSSFPSLRPLAEMSGKQNDNFHLGSVKNIVTVVSCVCVCVCQPVRIRSIHLATTFASSILKHMGGLNFTTLSQGPSVLTQIRSSSFSLRPSSKIIIEGGISFRTVDIVFWNSVMVFLFYLFTTSAAVFVAGVFCSRSCTSSRPTNRPTPL